MEEEYYYDYLYDKKAAKSMKSCFYSLVGIILLVILSLLFSGCKSIQYVPVETVKTEYINRVDTIKQTDSVFKEKETIIKEADSSLVAKLGLQLKTNEKAILILQKELEKQISKESEHKIDTIVKVEYTQVPYPVERALTKWESIKMDMGGIAIGASIVLVLIIIIYSLIWTYRKT